MHHVLVAAAECCDQPTHRNLEQPDYIPFTPAYRLPDRFQLNSMLGSGGSAKVFRAEDRLHPRRDLALKVAPRQSYMSDESAAEYYNRERCALHAVSCTASKHLPHMYCCGTCEGASYFALDYIDGWSTAELIDLNARKGLPWSIAAEIALQSCDSLAWVHYLQLNHRDVKPGNLMVSRQGRVVLSDFGLALEENFDLEGQLEGTPSFMSPEQARARKCDRRSDIYSLGLTLFTLITGVNPLEGKTVLETMLLHTEQDVPDVRDYVPDVPEDLALTIAKAVNRKPVRRFQTVDALESRLKVHAAGRGNLRRYLATFAGRAA